MHRKQSLLHMKATLFLCKLAEMIDNRKKAWTAFKGQPGLLLEAL
jgi:hypothetical protein